MVISAYDIKGDGKGTILTGDAISKKIKAKSLAWVHLDANDAETKKWLRDNVSYLDTIIIDALLAEETRPRISEFEQGAMMILRGVNLHEDASPEDMISIRLWVDESRIISVQKRDSRTNC